MHALLTRAQVLLLATPVPAFVFSCMDYVQGVLQALVVADEREDVTNKGVKLIWEEGKDEWAPYAMAHMEAIRCANMPARLHPCCPAVPVSLPETEPAHAWQAQDLASNTSFGRHQDHQRHDPLPWQVRPASEGYAAAGSAERPLPVIAAANVGSQ
jgi:hypothetical protein